MSLGLDQVEQNDLLVYEMRAPRIPKLWETADVLVRSIELAISNWFWAPFERQAVTTVCTELLENTIKYSDWKQKASPTFYFQCYDNRKVTVRTTNVVDPNDEHYHNFQRIVAQLKDPETAQAAYDARMCEIALSKEPVGDQTQLGLLRLAYENRCSMSCKLSSNNVLEVSATMDLNWLWS